MLVRRQNKLAAIVPIQSLAGSSISAGPLTAKARDLHARAVRLQKGAKANAGLRRFTAGASGKDERRRLFREAISLETEAASLAGTINRKGSNR